MTHQNTLLTQTQICPKGFDDEQSIISDPVDESDNIIPEGLVLY